MNYKKLDQSTNFARRKVLLATVAELGYTYISEALIELYKIHSLRKVAKILGWHVSFVRRHLTNWKVERRPRGGKHGGLQSGEMVANEDTSITEIAQELGVSPERARQILHDAIVHFRKNWIEMYGNYNRGLSDREFFDRYCVGVMSGKDSGIVDYFGE